ncbi:MAG TPA: FtsX-like permease family protein [Armatimonadota bacterium]
MLTLFRFISWRHLAGERFKTAVAVLGVALGIAVFLAIRLANGSVLAAFRSTVDAVSGKAQLRVYGGPQGLADGAYLKVRGAREVAAVAPIVEAAVVAPDWHNMPVTVLGVDLFSEPAFRSYTLEGGKGGRAAADFLGDPHAIAVGERLAKERGLHLGSHLRLAYGTESREWHVVAILKSDELGQAYAGRIAVVDIAAAQEAFGRLGRLSRIDVLTAPDASVGEVRATLQRTLGGGVSVERPRARSEQVESLLAAFQLNLTALSAIAVFVGMFLIYNAMSIAVVRRRREIGILRELGVTRRQIAGMFLVEGAAYGVAGSAVGVALGIALAKAALGTVSATVTALYIRVEAEHLAISAAIVAQAVAVGLVTAVIASVAPAIEAAGTPPGQTAREGSRSGTSARTIALVSLAGALMLAIAGTLSWAATVYRQPYAGMAAAFAIMSGFCLLTPAITTGLSRIARPVWDRLFGAEGLLAAGYLSASLDRTSIVVAALMVSLAMFVGVSVMVGSFRRTVEAWVDQTIRADLFLQSSTRDVSGADATVPPRVLEGLKNLPTIRAIDEYRSVDQTYRGRQTVLFAATFDVLAREGRQLFRRGESREVIAHAKQAGEAIVTEGFALKFRVNEGDAITLETPTGRHTFRIAGVFYDYETGGPMISVDRGLYRKVWRDDTVDSMAIYLKPGMDPLAVRTQIERRFAKDRLDITANRELHDLVLRIFDQTFSVTYALEFISVLVAVLGIINTMTALILQRGRELGILRAVGATRRQLQRIILLESALIGGIGYVIGAACGSALGLLLIYVINKQFFGWTVQVHWTPDVFVQGAAIMIATSILAGWLPARQAGNRRVIEAVRAE